MESTISKVSKRGSAPAAPQPEGKMPPPEVPSCESLNTAPTAAAAIGSLLPENMRWTVSGLVEVVPVVVDDSPLGGAQKAFCQACISEHEKHIDDYNKSVSSSAASREVIKVYIDEMESFRERFLDESIAQELHSNTSKGDNDHALKVINNYRAAWKHLCGCPKDRLNLDVLCETHLILTDGLLESCGLLRTTKSVKAGRTVFIPPSSVAECTDAFLVELGIMILENRDMFSVAAWVCYKGLLVSICLCYLYL